MPALSSQFKPMDPVKFLADGTTILGCRWSDDQGLELSIIHDLIYRLQVTYVREQAEFRAKVGLS
jgi:hypothetical protein